MRMLALTNSFRARLLLLLVFLLGLTLGVQYYVNLRSVRSNARLIIEQEEAVMAGVGLGVSSISRNKYLDDLRKDVHQPLLDEHTGRVRNVLVVDSDGNVQDSLIKSQTPVENDDKSVTFTHVTQLGLPPLSSAVEFPNENEPLPGWLASAVGSKPQEPGAFYFPIDTTKGRWYIIVILGSTKDVNDILQQQTSKSLLYTLALLLATALLTSVFVWRFTRPIKYLSIAARRVAGGDFSSRVPVDRVDEMGSLSAAFNEMTAGLARARELENQLHEAEKGAVVGRLAAAIAHEIRNPLNYINLTLDHLRSSFAPSDPAKRETFEKLTEQLKSEVARINRHITDFLKYSRPSMLELQPVDLRAEAEDALRVIGVQAVECGIKTRVETRGDPPTVIADRDSLRSILTNLLINALQAIDSEGGEVTIRLSTDHGAQVARIDIIDTGHGIDPQDIAKVFEPYYSTKETGTGLGLAIVRKALDDHGGTISVKSKKGRGTTFTITLPLNRSEANSDGSKIPDVAAENATTLVS
jgi:signal transduction histidine kinase